MRASHFVSIAGFAAALLLLAACSSETASPATSDAGAAADASAAGAADAAAQLPDVGVAVPPDASAPEAPDATAPEAPDAAQLPDAGPEAADAAQAPFAYHVPLDLPGTGSDVADPHCILVDGTWYLYLTSSAKDLEVWTSTDLVQWTNAGVVWAPTVGSWNDVTDTGSFGAWAPSVHRGDDGAYYLYYTAALRIGVARAATPLGPFLEVLDHPLLGDGYGGVGNGERVSSGINFATDFEEFTIDAFVLRTAAGALYLYAVVYTPLSNIAVWPMTDMTTLASDTPTILGTPDVLSWEGVIMEGPFVEERGGKYLLTYSGNTYLTTAYSLGVTVADSPLGPFTKDPGNPFFATDDARGIYGPGHHSFVDGPAGQPVIVYHAKASSFPGANRQIRIGPVQYADSPPVTVLFP